MTIIRIPNRWLGEVDVIDYMLTKGYHPLSVVEQEWRTEVKLHETLDETQKAQLADDMSKSLSGISFG